MTRLDLDLHGTRIPEKSLVDIEEHNIVALYLIGLLRIHLWSSTRPGFTSYHAETICKLSHERIGPLLGGKWPLGENFDVEVLIVDRLPE